MAAESLQVYRQLLRSISHAFKGDLQMLTAARQEVRSRLESSRSVVDSVQLSQLREEGKEAASFLRTSLVQATATDRGTYEMRIGKEHVGTYAEPVEPGMPLPREKKKKDK